MNLSLLRVLLFGLAYLVIIEGALEIRAHFRGFDTIAFGTFQRQDLSVTTMPPSPQNPRATPASDTPDKKKGEIRYWIASSSHAEDVYLSRELVFPVRLETLLKSTGQAVTVINASHAGMDIEANRTELEIKGTRAQPDFVILYQMSTQITKLSKQLLSGKHPSSPKGQGSNNPPPPPQPSHIAQWYETTSVYALLKGNVSNWLTGQRVLADSLGDRADEEFEREVKEFVNTVRQVGAQPVLCTFATSHTQRNLPNIPPEVPGLLFRYNVYLSLSGWFDTITRFNHILKRIANEQHIPLIDIDAAISGHSEYFRDFVHFTPDGHQKVAQTIVAGLHAQAPKQLAGGGLSVH
ncbi:MAG: SGNH/GDSL hydrolase family protein [Nitrospira sp.]|nr:SGNH/GDSL hydrolase family protein [Nitrospira sp.]